MIEHAATSASVERQIELVVAGEALIDFASVGDLLFQGYAGGSPLNSAVAASRLGLGVAYVTQLSTDLFGVRLRRHLEANAIDTSLVLSSPAPSTLAFVEHVGHDNRYQFLAAGAADTLYAPDPLPALPATAAVLQFGSVSLLSEPAATTFTRLVEAYRDRLLVVFDPNVRPTLIADAAAYRARCEGWIEASHVVKLSDDDLGYLVPAGDPADAIDSWLRRGPRAVVVTSGGGGARLHHRRGAIDGPAFEVDIVDTIGAGDTFTAGIVAGLLERGAATPDAVEALAEGEWRGVLRLAAAAAALNCTRAGADAPTRQEVAAFLAR